MNKLIVTAALALSFAAFACAAPSVDDSADATGSAESAQSAKPLCGPSAAPRRSVQPTPSASVQAKHDAWVALDSGYTAAAAVLGRACATDADCATHDDRFPGSCLTPYYGQAQCTVANAPSRPVFTCADYTCPANYECSQEGSESVVCLEHRLCLDAATGGRKGGAGGGRN